MDWNDGTVGDQGKGPKTIGNRWQRVYNGKEAEGKRKSRRVPSVSPIGEGSE